jgi:hypothetical protein
MKEHDQDDAGETKREQNPDCAGYYAGHGEFQSVNLKDRDTRGSQRGQDTDFAGTFGARRGDNRDQDQQCAPGRSPRDNPDQRESIGGYPADGGIDFLGGDRGERRKLSAQAVAHLLHPIRPNPDHGRLSDIFRR